MDELLGHKGQPWRWQIKQCLSRDLSPLHCHFFVKRVEGRPVANVSLCLCSGLGILGHVFTLPEFRGRGFASELLARALEGQGARLYLGCEPDSPAQRMYEKVGFASLSPGFMARGPLPPLKGGARRRVAPQWHHWPGVVHLGAQQAAPVCWEGRFLEVLREGSGWVELEGERVVRWSGW